MTSEQNYIVVIVRTRRTLALAGREDNSDTDVKSVCSSSVYLTQSLALTTFVLKLRNSVLLLCLVRFI
jgi:hypothetical protein